MITWSEWRLTHEAPGAVVEAAKIIANGNVEAGLEIIAKHTDVWYGRVARWLLEERGELERVAKELEAGLRPRRELIDEVLKGVRGSP